jgi:hypothetical protein
VGGVYRHADALHGWRGGLALVAVLSGAIRWLRGGLRAPVADGGRMGDVGLA